MKMMDDEFGKAIHERMNNLMDRETNTEIRENVQVAMKTGQSFHVMLNEDVTITGMKEGIVMYYKGDPILGFERPENSAAFVEIFMNWTMCAVGIEIATSNAIQERFEEIVQNEKAEDPNSRE